LGPGYNRIYDAVYFGDNKFLIDFEASKVVIYYERRSSIWKDLMAKVYKRVKV